MMIIKDVKNVYYSKKTGNWNKEIIFDNFCFDTREIKENCFFVAHKGENNDAHKYLSKDLLKKISFLIIEDEDKLDFDFDIPVLVSDDVIKTILDIIEKVRKQNKEQTIVAITGTTGKTTTKDITYSILNTELNVGKTRGNMNTEWGVPYTYLNNLDKDYLVVELGMDHLHDIKKLTEPIDPDFSVITNISKVHLLYMGNIEKIYEGKTELLKYGSKDSFRIVNGDNKYLQKAKQEFENVLSYGMSSNNDFVFSLSINDRNKIELNLNNNQYKIPLWGRFNAFNSAAGIIIADELGLSEKEIQNGINNIKISKNRLSINKVNDKILINDCYNSSPYALKNMVDEIEFYYHNDAKALILGDMLELGAEEKKLHKEAIQYINQKLKNKKLFFYGDIFYAFKEQFPENEFFNDKVELIRRIIKQKDKFKVFLFKGSRGMKLETVYKKLNGSIK